LDKEITWTDFGKLCLDMTEDERIANLAGCYKFEVFNIPCTKCDGDGYYGPDVVITTPCQGYDDGHDFHMCENFDEEGHNVYEVVIDDEISTECCNICIEKYKNNNAYKNISVSSKKIEPKIRKSFECSYCYSGFTRMFRILNDSNILAETPCRDSAKRVLMIITSKKEKSLLKLFEIHE
jgi:hypothetical protein